MNNLMTGIISFFGALLVFLSIIYVFNYALTVEYEETAIEIFHPILYTLFNFLLSGLVAIVVFVAMFIGMSGRRSRYG